MVPPKIGKMTTIAPATITLNRAQFHIERRIARSQQKRGRKERTIGRDTSLRMRVGMRVVDNQIKVSMDD